MPLLAAALTYGSFGDIKETAKLTRRIIEILYDGGRPSSEGERIILVLKDLYKDVATVLILPGIDSSSAHAQSAVGELSAKLALCHSLLAKLYAKIRPSNSFLAKVWMVISEEKALASWRAEITEHRASLHTTLQSLNIAISNESREQLELVRSNVQYIRAEVERVGFQVHSLESQTVVASNHLVSQVSNVENQLRQLIQKMSLHDVSEPMFFVTDPLRRCTIPIPLFYCVDFNALHAILIAYLRNRPEAGARYVERGDYNIVSPEGVVVRRVQFAGIVKAGMRFDMSIVKRQKHQVRPNLEECPNCHQINPKVRCNEWIDCSNPECGQRYQISAKIAREEIYSQQLSGEEERPISQENVETDSFYLVQIVYLRNGSLPQKSNGVQDLTANQNPIDHYGWNIDLNAFGLEWSGADSGLTAMWPPAAAGEGHVLQPQKSNGVQDLTPNQNPIDHYGWNIDLNAFGLEWSGTDSGLTAMWPPAAAGEGHVLQTSVLPMYT